MTTKSLILSLALCASFNSYSQFTFGVSPGLGLNSAYFGYRMNKFVPFFSFQFLTGKFTYEEKGQEYDYDQGQMVSYTDTEVFKGGLYLPSLGAKYFAVENSSLKAYFSLTASKPLISGSFTENGVKDDELDDYVKNASLWAGQLGFGVEYFFNDQFSIGGEFGWSMLYLKYTNSRVDDVYNPDTDSYVESTFDRTVNSAVSPTYTRIGFNFYFGAGK